jgi:zinc transporter ZupT
VVVDPSVGVVPLLATLGLATVHLWAGRLRFLEELPRSRFLSVAGGVSVAYVFVHVFPELERTSRAVDRAWPGLGFLDDHVYLITLVGFVAYYGLERLVKCSLATEPPSRGVFWLHIGSFSVYNALIGYLVVHGEAPGVGNVVVFAVAMALHFLVNDFGLRREHRDSYRRYGRWFLAAGVVAGALVGSVPAVSEAVLGNVFAFLAGGIVLNVIKEELPEERESRFWAFAAGAAAYTLLLMLV